MLQCVLQYALRCVAVAEHSLARFLLVFRWRSELLYVLQHLVQCCGVLRCAAVRVAMHLAVCCIGVFCLSNASIHAQCLRMYVYELVYLDACVCTYILTYIAMCMHACIHKYIKSTYTHTSVHTRIHARTCIQIASLSSKSTCV